MLKVFHRDEATIFLPMISSDARLIVWPGVEAEYASMNHVRLEPGEANQEHSHPDSEDTIYILEGEGTVADISAGKEYTFQPGDAIHIPPGVVHAVRADRGVPVVSVGGPCPPDLRMLQAMGVLDDRDHG